MARIVILKIIETEIIAGEQRGKLFQDQITKIQKDKYETNCLVVFFSQVTGMVRKVVEETENVSKNAFEDLLKRNGRKIKS